MDAWEKHRRRIERLRAARGKVPFGLPDDFAGIVAALEALPTRDELAALAPDQVATAALAPEPRRKGGDRLTGAAAAARNRRLTRLRWARLTDEQRAEHNRKRTARRRRKAALLRELDA